MLIEDRMENIIKELQSIDRQIKSLDSEKQTLNLMLSEMFEHPMDTDKSTSYEMGQNKITITSGYNYTLKKDNLNILSSLREEYNPVKERIAYDLDKSIIRDCEKYGTAHDILLMSELISKSPKKLHVKIGEAK